MAKDIIIDNPILNGDWNIGHSDQQHIQHILMAKPGDFKNAPLLGVNVPSLMHASLSPLVVQSLEKNIRLNLEADGVKNISVSIDPTTTSIYANGQY